MGETQEEKKIILGVEALAELKQMNSQISVLCAQVGNVDRVIRKYETQKNAGLQQIEGIELKMNEMVSTLVKTYGLSKEFNWTIDWETGELKKVVAEA